MAVRSGVGRFTLVDPDLLAVENVGRHVLSRRDVGKPKVLGLKAAIEEVNPAAIVETICGKFDGLSRRPDLVIAATDSFECDSSVNDYCIRERVAAAYGGCWGEASVGEILYVVPGKTPCYECYAGFRRGAAEIPPDRRKYTDPDFDVSKVPGQAGLWANILIVSGVMFQVALGLLDSENPRHQIIDHEHTLLLVNVTAFDSGLQPLAVTFGKINRGCAVCDQSKLVDLGKNLVVDRAPEAV
jgi:hypothetical protein